MYQIGSGAFVTGAFTDSALIFAVHVSDLNVGKYHGFIHADISNGLRPIVSYPLK